MEGSRKYLGDISASAPLLSFLHYDQCGLARFFLFESIPSTRRSTGQFTVDKRFGFESSIKAFPPPFLFAPVRSLLLALVHILQLKVASGLR